MVFFPHLPEGPCSLWIQAKRNKHHGAIAPGWQLLPGWGFQAREIHCPLPFPSCSLGNRSEPPIAFGIRKFQQMLINLTILAKVNKPHAFIFQTHPSF